MIQEGSKHVGPLMYRVRENIIFKIWCIFWYYLVNPLTL